MKKILGIIPLLILITSCNGLDDIEHNEISINERHDVKIPSSKHNAVLVYSINDPYGKTFFRDTLISLCGDIDDIDQRQILVFNDDDYLVSDAWRNVPLLRENERDKYNAALVAIYQPATGTITIHPGSKEKSKNILIGKSWCK